MWWGVFELLGKQRGNFGGSRDIGWWPGALGAPRFLIQFPPASYFCE